MLCVKRCFCLTNIDCVGLCSLPLAVNFFVFIIFAANSNPVDFWTHLLTIENAPLKYNLIIVI